MNCNHLLTGARWLLVVGLVLIAGAASATNRTWTNATGDGSFQTPGNWSPSGIPGPADTVIFGTLSSTYDINFGSSSTVSRLTVATGTNPLSFAGFGSTFTLVNTSTSDTDRALVIGAVLSTSLAQLNTVYGTLGSDTGSSGTLNVNASGTFAVTGTAATYGLIVGRNGTGAININNGADASVAGDTVLGENLGSTGSITVSGAGSTWTSSGILNVGFNGMGILTVSNGGAFSASSLTVGSQGTLTGNSNIDASVSNSGTVAPGTSPGALHINGAYTQTTAGKLQIELGGITAGTQYDQLLVSGAVSLAGTLQVTLTGAFMPAENNVFDLLDFAGLAGTFGTINLPALPGSLQWDTSNLYTTGILSVVLSGDYNVNGIVDAADYVVWRKGFGITFLQSDFNVWRAHFGQTASGAGSSSGASATADVPEPTALLLLMFAPTGWWIWRSRAA